MTTEGRNKSAQLCLRLVSDGMTRFSNAQFSRGALNMWLFHLSPHIAWKISLWKLQNTREIHAVCSASTDTRSPHWSPTFVSHALRAHSTCLLNLPIVSSQWSRSWVRGEPCPASGPTRCRVLSPKLYKFGKGNCLLVDKRLGGEESSSGARERLGLWGFRGRSHKLDWSHSVLVLVFLGVMIMMYGWLRSPLHSTTQIKIWWVLVSHICDSNVCVIVSSAGVGWSVVLCGFSRRIVLTRLNFLLDERPWLTHTCPPAQDRTQHPTIRWSLFFGRRGGGPGSSSAKYRRNVWEVDKDLSRWPSRSSLMFLPSVFQLGLQKNLSACKGSAPWPQVCSRWHFSYAVKTSHRSASEHTSSRSLARIGQNGFTKSIWQKSAKELDCVRYTPARHGVALEFVGEQDLTNWLGFFLGVQEMCELRIAKFANQVWWLDVAGKDHTREDHKFSAAPQHQNCQTCSENFADTPRAPGGQNDVGTGRSFVGLVAVFVLCWMTSLATALNDLSRVLMRWAKISPAGGGVLVDPEGRGRGPLTHGSLICPLHFCTARAFSFFLGVVVFNVEPRRGRAPWARSWVLCWAIPVWTPRKSRQETNGSTGWFRPSCSASEREFCENLGVREPANVLGFSVFSGTLTEWTGLVCLGSWKTTGGNSDGLMVSGRRWRRFSRRTVSLLKRPSSCGQGTCSNSCNNSGSSSSSSAAGNNASCRCCVASRTRRTRQRKCRLLLAPGRPGWTSSSRRCCVCSPGTATPSARGRCLRRSSWKRRDATVRSAMSHAVYPGRLPRAWSPASCPATLQMTSLQTLRAHWTTPGSLSANQRARRVRSRTTTSPRNEASSCRSAIRCTSVCCQGWSLLYRSGIAWVCTTVSAPTAGNWQGQTENPASSTTATGPIPSRCRETPLFGDPCQLTPSGNFLFFCAASQIFFALHSLLW